MTTFLPPRIAPILVGMILFGFQISRLEGQCPISAAHGQPFDDATWARPNNPAVEGFWKDVYDDFVPLGDTMTAVVVWGAYVRTLPNGAVEDCSEWLDRFDVYVEYQLPDSGMPFFPVGHSDVATMNVLRTAVTPSAYEDQTGIRVYESRLTLDAPIGGLDPSGQTAYWLTVTNEIVVHPGQPDCVWNWLGVDAIYNDYSAVSSFPSVGDMAFCTDVSLAPAPPMVRACCHCDGTCTEQTLRECDDVVNRWRLYEPSCEEIQCPTWPENDHCPTVLDVSHPFLPVDQIVWTNNSCADTDGPNPAPPPWNNLQVLRDVWFKYKAECDGRLFVAVCPAAPSSGVDGMEPAIAVYHDPGNPTVCRCPTAEDQGDLLWPPGSTEYDGCTDLMLPNGRVAMGFTHVGECYVIRVGGYPDDPWGRGEAPIVASCIPYPSPPWPGDNFCSNDPQAWIPCGSHDECPGGYCRLKNRFISFSPPDYELLGIRVTLTELSPDSVADPSIYNGTFRWVGVPTLGINDGVSAPFSAAALGCDYHEQYWYSAGLVHVYGAAVVPSSRYDVQMCDLQFGCSTPVRIDTAKFGDVKEPYVVSQPSFTDIGAIVDKFQSKVTGPSKTRTKLKEPVVPSEAVGFVEIGTCVSAFQGKPYKALFPVPPPTCP